MDLLEAPVELDQLGIQDLKVLKEILVPLDLLEILVPWDNQVLLGLLDQLDQQDQPVHWVHQGNQDLRDHQDHLEMLDLQGLLDHLVL